MKGSRHASNFFWINEAIGCRSWVHFQPPRGLNLSVPHCHLAFDWSVLGASLRRSNGERVHGHHRWILTGSLVQNHIVNTYIDLSRSLLTLWTLGRLEACVSCLGILVFLVHEELLLSTLNSSLGCLVPGFLSLAAKRHALPLRLYNPRRGIEPGIEGLYTNH